VRIPGFFRAGIVGLFTAAGFLFLVTASFTQTQLDLIVNINGASITVGGTNQHLTLSVTAPSGSQRTNFKISTRGTCSDLGGGDGTCNSTGNSGGQFDVMGIGGSTHIISTSNLACAASGIIMSNINFEVGFQPSNPLTITLPLSGTIMVNWGADFSVPTDGASGACTLSVDVAFN
jgi:hypothetical protein